MESDIHRGVAAPRDGRTPAAGALALAAAPTFAIMAAWTALAPSPADLVCGGGPGVLPVGAMSTMYAMMSVFHAGPWIDLLSRRAGRPRRDGYPCG